MREIVVQNVGIFMTLKNPQKNKISHNLKICSVPWMLYHDHCLTLLVLYSHALENLHWQKEGSSRYYTVLRVCNAYTKLILQFFMACIFAALTLSPFIYINGVKSVFRFHSSFWRGLVGLEIPKSREKLKGDDDDHQMRAERIPFTDAYTFSHAAPFMF